MKTIALVVSEVLAVDPQRVKDGEDYIDDLGADSLDIREITMALEDEFGTDMHVQLNGWVHSNDDALFALKESGIMK